MTQERHFDTMERDLRIAVTQARAIGEDALRIAQQNLQNYLSSRLTLQIQHKRMEQAGNQADKQKVIGINDD